MVPIDVQYVSSCDLCQKSKTSQHRKRAPLKPLEVVEPFGRVHMDFIGQTTDRRQRDGQAEGPTPVSPKGLSLVAGWH